MTPKTDTCTDPEFELSALNDAERLAFTIAESQAGRDVSVMPNTAAALLIAIRRMAHELAHAGYGGLECGQQLIAEGSGPLLDPDCRDGKHASCTGPPCECQYHRQQTVNAALGGIT